MQEYRNLKASILTIYNEIKNIELLGFNLSQYKEKLDLIDESINVGDKLVLINIKLKERELAKIQKELKSYLEYFKLLNDLKLKKENITLIKNTKTISIKYIEEVIKLLKDLRRNGLILDSSQEQRLKELYKTLYEIICLEVLYNGNFDSELLREIQKDSYDTLMLNKIITEEIENIKMSAYVDTDIFKLLEKNIIFIESLGVFNFARLDIITKLIACTNDHEIETELIKQLISIHKTIGINKAHLISLLEKYKQALEEHIGLKENIKNNSKKLKERLVPFLLTLSLTLGVASTGTLIFKERTRHKEYKTETIIYNSLTKKTITSEAFQRELKQNFTRTRIDYGHPFWSNGEYHMRKETYDLTNYVVLDNYEDYFYIDLTPDNLDYFEVSKEDMKILEKVSEEVKEESIWWFASELIEISQDLETYVEVRDMKALIVGLLLFYSIIIIYACGPSKLFKSLCSDAKNIFSIIKSKISNKEDIKQINVEINKILLSYEARIADIQELSELYQSSKREIMNILGEKALNKETIQTILANIDNELRDIEEIKQNQKQLKKMLGEDK